MNSPMHDLRTPSAPATDSAPQDLQMPGTQMRFVSAEELAEAVGRDAAREAIAEALLSEFVPAEDPPRSHVSAGNGHLLLMPSSLQEWVGIKIASVAPENPAQGLPRIQAQYLLMDAATLTPRLLVDGSPLTLLRTPAVTAVACDHLAREDASRAVIFGSGPQAIEHAIAVALIRELTDVALIGRNAERTHQAVEALQERGIPARVGSAAEDVPGADIIVCATSSAEPLFDGALVADGACVAAMGSHEPDRRELDGYVLQRSLVVVEEHSAAGREAGDVVLAQAEGLIELHQLHELQDLVRGDVQRREDRPNVFKGTGMAWQDLAVVARLAARLPRSLPS